MPTMQEYERVHKSLEHKSAVQRERDLLEGIAPAIAFLERKVVDTKEALESLRRVRASALAEIMRLDGAVMDEESALRAIGMKMELFEVDDESDLGE